MAIRDPIEYPWYQIVAGRKFTQGDVIKDCPLPEPVPDEEFLVALSECQNTSNEAGVRAGPTGDAAPDLAMLDVNVKTATAIVLTQACDIENDKVESIVLCPVWTMGEAAQNVPNLNTERGKEDLRRGYLPHFHLLNKDDELGFPLSVVDFRVLYTLPADFLGLVAERAGERPRLLSPYREHLSQAFARYFMRVGLPIDIPSFR